MNWLDLRKIYERSKYREKRKKELRNEVERRFPHLSNRKYVIALAGDRKVEWRPDFIKRTGGLNRDMSREAVHMNLTRFEVMLGRNGSKMRLNPHSPSKSLISLS